MRNFCQDGFVSIQFSCKHGMKWPSHHVNMLRNHKVIPVWNSCRCEFSHVNTPYGVCLICDVTRWFIAWPWKGPSSTVHRPVQVLVYAKYFNVAIHKLRKIQFWEKLFVIGFPYKQCNFWLLYVTVKMAPKTMIRPILRGSLAPQ